MEDGCVYRVTVLKEGYSYQDDSGRFHADGTITLVQGRHVILVDTGGPQDKDTLLQQLSNLGLTPGMCSTWSVPMVMWTMWGTSTFPSRHTHCFL
ncbi:Metallo-beta-lactamase domain-containing protein 1 [Branchiostoma belcheri]|nr:Metallo-beta-lactamase domain-containing protein 1 [Branchiostoma belcheri]